MARHGRSDSPILLTFDEYALLPETVDHHTELVRGMVIREPLPGPYHGRTQVRLAYRLEAFVEENGLGAVFTEVGVVTTRGPDTVRGPDVFFYCSERLPHPLPRNFFESAPDLVVEVASPSNRMADILAKVSEYLEAGTEIVWVIDPIKRTAVVYSAQDDIRMLSEDDALDGRNVLPGLVLTLRDVLP